MAVNKQNIMMRYFFVVLVLSLVGIAIVVRAGIIMFAENRYWQEVADRFVRENVTVKPNRGNILSADGQLMASSLPEYRIYMDFKAGGKEKDSLLMKHMDEICKGLNRIFPDRTAAQFKRHLLAGRRKGSRNYLIYPKRISYIEYKEAKALPVFRLNKYKGGFHEQVYNQRKKPFGSLAARTLGDVYADTAQGAKNGLELAFDSLLRGRDGITHRQKVMNRYLNIIDRPAVDGCDIVTTIDVDMQDICEKALVDKLKELEAVWGVAVLMEVHTGDVKAIVNMTRAADGNYYEMKNLAISNMMEPGSTFKTASLMVALEDGKITPHTQVDTGNGVKNMHGSWMRDHNWHRGGYGVIDATRALEVSSNVGVSTLIDRSYAAEPQKFIDGLKRMGLDEPLHLQIAGEGKPYIKNADDPTFWRTSLPWMSIGYETQLPPINVLTFYNAIANDGVMVKPRFVTRAVKDGETVEEFPVEVLNEKICSDTTLHQIQVMLERVVSHGLAKPAQCKEFHVSGKTGTAQVSQGQAGYKSGVRNHLVSFCGYFPSEAPRYSCIVSIQINKGIPSGGGMAGSVFGRIAERVYAKNLRYGLEQAVDSNTNVIPQVKAGDMLQAMQVLGALDVPVEKRYGKPHGKEQAVWGQAVALPGAVELEETKMAEDIVPDVAGMGAKDAVYLMEKRGLRVRLHGTGQVKRQSVQAGSRIRKGATVVLTLSDK